jgi:hypothetical protein
MARNDQSFVPTIKEIVRNKYDDSPEPKANAKAVKREISSRGLSTGYNELHARGEVYEFGEHVRVTEDVLE